MKDKTFCFIICSNNEQYLAECLYYIERLHVPEGYSVEILSVADATSMTAGYNEGMRASEAKYKLYLHQDVFLVEADILYRILEIFEHPEIGMIGLVGSEKLPQDCIMWHGRRIGRIYTSNFVQSGEGIEDLGGAEYTPVEAIDGLLMITQYDLTWREDLFRGWDFYDISQSQEFIRAGYQVVVPRMENSWCIHDDGFLNLSSYYEARDIFMREYRK